jgi:hypothetical protein
MSPLGECVLNEEITKERPGVQPGYPESYYLWEEDEAMRVGG